MSRAAATDVVRRLRAAGYQALFAGGCVRDLVLGREPKDFDVATDALPRQVASLFANSQEVGARFGVVVVDGQVEVATFRRDGAYVDGRHPEGVTYSTDPQEDALRRDFTINGMFYDLERDAVLDFVGGRDDLKAGVIRAIGDPSARFQEDKLRLLRAVRFAARFGYRVEDVTWAAACRMAPEIHQVSAERLRGELMAILREGAARRGFELLDDSGLLAALLPEMAACKGVAQPPQFHPEGDVWIHTLMMLDGLRQPTATLAWGVLLHDVGKPPTFTPPQTEGDRIRFNQHAEVGTRMAEEICGRLRFSRRETDLIAALVAHHLRFKDVPQMRPATLKRFLRMENFEEHLELHRLDCLSSHRDLTVYDFVQKKIAETPPEEIRPQPLLNGDDLIAMGYTPGAGFQQMLRSVEDAQLEGRLHNAGEAREWILAHFPASR